VQVPLAEDEDPVEQLTPGGAHPPFRDRVRCGARIGVRRIRTPTAVNTASKTPVNLASRSRIRNRNRLACSPCQSADCGPVAPPTPPSDARSLRARYTRRLASSIMKNTYSRRRNTVSTVKKSQASTPCAGAARNSPPGRSHPARRRIQTGPLENGPHRAGPDPVAEPAQLTVNPAATPARILPRQPQHQPAQLRRHRRTTVAPMRSPTPPHQIPMPTQQRLRPHEQHTPPMPRQDPTQPGADRPIRPRQARPSDPTPQHRHMAAQDQDFDVLRRRAPAKQHEPAQDLNQPEMARVLPDPLSRCRSCRSGSHRTTAERTPLAEDPRTGHPRTPRSRPTAGRHRHRGQMPTGTSMTINLS
jgi:hypothetical protein